MSCHGQHDDDARGGHQHQETARGGTPGRLVWWVAGAGALAAVAWLLLQGGGGGNLLAYGVLLLCPLMHLFMHRGHQHGGHRHPPRAQGKWQDESDG